MRADSASGRGGERGKSIDHQAEARGVVPRGRVVACDAAEFEIAMRRTGARGDVEPTDFEG